MKRHTTNRISRIFGGVSPARATLGAIAAACVIGAFSPSASAQGERKYEGQLVIPETIERAGETYSVLYKCVTLELMAPIGMKHIFFDNGAFLTASGAVFQNVDPLAAQPAPVNALTVTWMNAAHGWKGQPVGPDGYTGGGVLIRGAITAVVFPGDPFVPAITGRLKLTEVKLVGGGGEIIEEEWTLPVVTFRAAAEAGGNKSASKGAIGTYAFDFDDPARDYPITLSNVEFYSTPARPTPEDLSDSFDSIPKSLIASFPTIVVAPQAIELVPVPEVGPTEWLIVRSTLSWTRSTPGGAESASHEWLMATGRPLCPADIDGDDDVDVFDFGLFAGNFGASGMPLFGVGDLDGDGDVDVFDFAVFAGNFGCLN